MTTVTGARPLESPMAGQAAATQRPSKAGDEAPSAGPSSNPPSPSKAQSTRETQPTSPSAGQSGPVPVPIPPATPTQPRASRQMAAASIPVQPAAFESKHGTRRATGFAPPRNEPAVANPLGHPFHRRDTSVSSAAAGASANAALPAPSSAAAALAARQASKDLAISWASLEDPQHIGRLLVRCALDHELQGFYAWPTLKSITERLAGDVTLSLTCEESGLKPEIGQDLAKLALYDVFVVPHAALLKEPEPRAALTALMRNLIRASTRLSEDKSTSSLHLAHGREGDRAEFERAFGANDLEERVNALAGAEGAASLAKRLECVLDAITAGGKSVRPRLIVLLSGGGPAADETRDVADAIKAGREAMDKAELGNGAAFIMAAALGNDQAAHAWAQRITTSASLSAPASVLQQGTSAGAVARNVSALLKAMRTVLAPAFDAAATPKPATWSQARATLEQESHEYLWPEEGRAGARGAGGAGEDADVDAGGSALANVRLSTKKKEALGRVPCKFFRNSSNGCSAGASCPFAHTLPGEGQNKQICEWFVKGNCRFGHRCALAHVLPGQPMSMDRKNKKAAQHGMPLPSAVTPTSTPPTGSSANKTPRPDREQRLFSQQSLQQSGQNHLPSHLSAGHDYQLRLLGRQGSQQIGNSVHSMAHGHRDVDFPFGLPDDLQPPISPPPNFDGLPYDPSVMSISGGMGAFGGHPYGAFPAGAEAAAAAAAARRGGPDVLGTSIGSAAASRAFGTSPFSQPGGHSVFFSGSQEMDEQRFGGRAILDHDEAVSSAGPGVPVNGGGDDAGLNEEDFLPSSLSDLLTPAELQRRARNGKSADVAQSMPIESRAHAAALWELQQRSSKARQALAEEMLALERLAAAEAKLAAANGHGLSAYRIGGHDLGHVGRMGGASPFAAGLGLDGATFGTTDALLASRRVGNGLGRAHAGIDASLGEAVGPGADSFSPATNQRAAMHEPGRSLPQGLAAGLSSLHLTSSAAAPRSSAAASGASTRSGISRGNEPGNAPGGGSFGGGTAGLSSSSSSSRRASLAWGGAGLGARDTGFSSTALHGGFGGLGAGEDPLGPTAPSSIFASRAGPLSLAMARSATAGHAFPSSHETQSYQGLGAATGLGQLLQPPSSQTSGYPAGAAPTLQQQQAGPGSGTSKAMDSSSPVPRAVGVAGGPGTVSSPLGVSPAGTATGGIAIPASSAGQGSGGDPAGQDGGRASSSAALDVKAGGGGGGGGAAVGNLAGGAGTVATAAAAAAAGGMGRHPGMSRVRGSIAPPSQASPVTLPTTGEEVDEAIFELE